MRARPMDFGVGVELLFTENRMGTTKFDHATCEAENLVVLLQITPVMPARFIVLTVSVVIATLCATKFVSAEQHRHAARDQQSQEEILDLNFSRSLDPGIHRLAFSTAVLAVVGVGPILVVFSVCFVVLVAIAH